MGARPLQSAGMSEEELVTLTTVAKETGYSRERLRQFAAKGELPAQLLGKTWVVKRSDVSRFLSEHHPKTGRPRGSRNRPKPPTP